MRVLVVHNTYRQRGGEDAVVDAEVELLRAHGHEVLDWRRHNDELDQGGRLRAALGTVWSTRSHRLAQEAAARFAPDVVHVHNTFAVLSPSVIWAFARRGLPIVQTLHNYRSTCVQAMLLRDGQPCEACLGRLPLPALRHRCYRDSLAYSGAVAAMIATHRGLGTWRRKVHRFIALSRFSAERFVAAGLPADRLRVKPNFVDLPAAPLHAAREGLLFVGRLSPEKGIVPLAAALRRAPQLRLRVIGDGPLAGELRDLPNVEALGPQPLERVFDEMHRARALVLPSLSYEHFPRTLVEAFAARLPVVAHRIGALAELVEHGRTGWLCDPADPSALLRAMREAVDDPGRSAALGDAARARYEALYTPERNHRELLRIYEEARDEARGPVGAEVAA